MKTSYPDLQRKAASILEFITIIDPSMDTIISADIESGLDAIFQQKALEGNGNNFLCCQTKFVLYCKTFRSQLNHVCSLKVQSRHGWHACSVQQELPFDNKIY